MLPEANLQNGFLLYFCLERSEKRWPFTRMPRPRYSPDPGALPRRPCGKVWKRSILFPLQPVGGRSLSLPREGWVAPLTILSLGSSRTQLSQWSLHWTAENHEGSCFSDGGYHPRGISREDWKKCVWIQVRPTLGKTGNNYLRLRGGI